MITPAPYNMCGMRYLPLVNYILALEYHRQVPITDANVRSENILPCLEPGGKNLPEMLMNRRDFIDPAAVAPLNENYRDGSSTVLIRKCP